MSVPKTKYKVAIVAPTCFYSQVSLFRKLAEHPRIDLMVYFCSDEALFARDVRHMYGTDSRWENEDTLLTGFNFKFMRNYSPMASYLKWPLGLVNLGIWNARVGSKKRNSTTSD